MFFANGNFVYSRFKIYVVFTSQMLLLIRGFNNFGDKRLFEVEQTAVIEKGP